MTNAQPHMADFATPQDWMKAFKAWDAAAIAVVAEQTLAFPELTDAERVARQERQDAINAKTAATKAANAGKPKWQGPPTLCASHQNLKDGIADGTACPETHVTYEQLGKLAKRAAERAVANAEQSAKNTAANAAQGAWA